ncbi:MAG: helix-hairpin-helix domain-containing protein [Flavobacteriaceae bacterium]
MDRRSYKSHFKFNKQERSGIFFLLLLIVVFQIVYFVAKSYPTVETSNSITIDGEYQAEIDALIGRNQQKDTIPLYPFNPNFITDYKGYILGMSPAEIERLQVFRAGNQFVNSAEEFQKVTLVSDTLMESLVPYFKFPEWANKVNKRATVGVGPHALKPMVSDSLPDSGKVKDINRATAQELRAVKGIGDILSQRIVKFRDLLGGFLVEEQLGHVYGLEPEVVVRVLKNFRILESPSITKININQASPGDISKLVYLKYELAARIVAYREANGGITSFDELKEIEDFPTERLDIIKLYLQL